ncbi:translation initiation factor 2 [Streptomyces sp. NPDC058486]|uniref:translation initiation factor 2 n=1 Tax=unclassified Streptomyces TaxID=2593676 RepID=UPI00365E07AB
MRSAGALHRLLDVLPVFHGDPRVLTRFTLVPGSDFDIGALAALDRSGARTLPWDEALRIPHDLILAASPKGALHRLAGPRVLLPHGAGFNKSVHGDGSPGLPSGLDPHYLLAAHDEPWADLHALAHENQVVRLGSRVPRAASRTVVVGDPTLDRVLASTHHRDSYRDALGTGPRRLVAVTSTWGPESLLARRPGLVAELTGLLPYDAYQVALILHPNQHSRIGAFDLARHLSPAVAAGLLLASPYEEWAALLVAADAVVSDHGSTALYAAALGLPVVDAYDGGDELLPGSPMAHLLDAIPRLASASGLEAAIEAARTVDTRAHAAEAFAWQGEAHARLRTQLYRLLRLHPLPDPVSGEVGAPAFPRPSSSSRRPPAFAVRAEVTGERVTVRRFPAHSRQPSHHLAAEFPAADPRQLQSASVVWRHAGVPAHAALPHTTWTAEGWTARTLEDHPGCRTAAAVLARSRVLIRHRSAGLTTARVEPGEDRGRLSYPDPSVVVSAVHAWLSTRTETAPRATLVCEAGPVVVRVHLEPARPDDLRYEL